MALCQHHTDNIVCIPGSREPSPKTFPWMSFQTLPVKSKLLSYAKEYQIICKLYRKIPFSVEFTHIPSPYPCCTVPSCAGLPALGANSRLPLWLVVHSYDDLAPVHALLGEEVIGFIAFNELSSIMAASCFIRHYILIAPLNTILLNFTLNPKSVKTCKKYYFVSTLPQVPFSPSPAESVMCKRRAKAQ